MDASKRGAPFYPPLAENLPAFGNTGSDFYDLMKHGMGSGHFKSKSGEFLRQPNESVELDYSNPQILHPTPIAASKSPPNTFGNSGFYPTTNKLNHSREGGSFELYTPQPQKQDGDAGKILELPSFGHSMNGESKE